MMKKVLYAVFAVFMLAVLVTPVAIMATTDTYYSSSSDGWVAASNATYSTANAAASASVVNKTGTYAVVGQADSGSVYDIYRSALYFDTSSIPDGAVISAATIYLYGQGKDIIAGGNFLITVTNGQATYPHDPLEAGDFSRGNYSGSGAENFSTTSFNVGSYNAITLNATGIGWLNLTGTTKLLIRSSRDVSQTVPGGAETIRYYTSEETGTSKDPYLSVTYTVPAAPTITASAATLVDDDSARLNGTIDDDGGYPAAVEVSWGYGKVSQTAGNFASYTTVTAFAGTYSTGETPLYDAAGLDAGSTYYYRFQAKNTTGTTTSDEITFTTMDTPSITSKPASNIAQTTARLNGQINSSGGEANEIRWGYGTTSELAAAFEDYDTVTAWGGSYDTGALPFLDIATLTAAETYYFRFQARNSIGTTTSGELDFTTETSVGTPSNLIGIPDVTTIDLSWSGGAGATQYMIRTKAGEFPTTTVDGSLIYLGTGRTFEVVGLTSGTTYYFSIWGESGGTYSASYATCLVTTNAGADISDDGVIISAPWRWMSAPNHANLANLPVVYDAVNGVADSILMPRATFWMLIALFTSAIGGIMAYVSAGQSGRGASSQAIGMVVGFVLLCIWWAMQIVPSYIIALDLLFVVLLIRSKREMD